MIRSSRIDYLGMTPRAATTENACVGDFDTEVPSEDACYSILFFPCYVRRFWRLNPWSEVPASTAEKACCCSSGGVVSTPVWVRVRVEFVPQCASSWAMPRIVSYIRPPFSVLVGYWSRPVVGWKRHFRPRKHHIFLHSNCHLWRRRRLVID